MILVTYSFSLNTWGKGFLLYARCTRSSEVSFLQIKWRSYKLYFGKLCIKPHMNVSYNIIWTNQQREEVQVLTLNILHFTKKLKNLQESSNVWMHYRISVSYISKPYYLANFSSHAGCPLKNVPDCGQISLPQSHFILSCQQCCYHW